MTVINFNQAMEQASKASFDPLPKGVYDLVCIETTPTESSTSKPMIKAKYQVETGPSAGKKVFTQYTFSPESDTALAIFFRQMAFHGLDATFFAANPAWETVAASLIGRRVRMQLDVRQWQGQDRNEVKQVMPPSDGGAVVAQVPAAAPPPQVAPPQVVAPVAVAPVAAPQVPAPAVPVAAPPVAPVAAPVAPVAAPVAPVAAPVAAPAPEVPQAAAPVAAPVAPAVAAPAPPVAAPVVPVAAPVAAPIVAPAVPGVVTTTAGEFVVLEPQPAAAPVAPAPVAPVVDDPSVTASEDL